MSLYKRLQLHKYFPRTFIKKFYRLKEEIRANRKNISPFLYEKWKKQVACIEEALARKDRLTARQLTEELSQMTYSSLKKTSFRRFSGFFFEFTFTLLLVATVHRLCFQLYQIPSGSMRPTLMEKDRLIATKSNFGINSPFGTSHLFFRPSSLHRGNILIFSADGLPMDDNRSKYLFIFPAKKQLVKRLIGKPGDTLYFYGGKVYGLDAAGNEIPEFQTADVFQNLYHVPFISLDGKIITDRENTSYLYQMNQKVAKFFPGSNGRYQGRFFSDNEWKKETEDNAYRNLWGIQNFAPAVIVSRPQALKRGCPKELLTEDYYLELEHTPRISDPEPRLAPDLQGRIRPCLSTEKTYIPLDASKLLKLREALTTSRFVVKEEKAGNYRIGRSFTPGPHHPRLPGIPNGTYEWIRGTAYRISSGGKAQPLPESHPLYATDPELIQKLFNMGVHMLRPFDPSFHYGNVPASRHAYFREGDLYVMGAPLFHREDPELIRFRERESLKVHGFTDSGIPDRERILRYGLKVPAGQYLLLGDNTENSADSRDFGFVPEKNIQGSPALIFLPRYKRPDQNHLDYLNFSNLLTWSLLIGGTGYALRRRRKIHRMPL